MLLLVSSRMAIWTGGRGGRRRLLGPGRPGKAPNPDPTARHSANSDERDSWDSPPSERRERTRFERRRRSRLLGGRLDQNALAVDEHQDVALERDAPLASLAGQLGRQVAELLGAERDDSLRAGPRPRS